MSESINNLLVIIRTTEQNGHELLVGQRKLGAFAGYDCLPGGKVVPDEDPVLSHERAASHVLGKQTGIIIPAEELSMIGRIMMNDQRKKFQRFGFTDVLLGYVDPDIEPADTEELIPRWVSLADPTEYTKSMPPDVRHWFPQVLYIEWPFRVHLNFSEETAGMRIIEAVYPQMIGALFLEREFALPDAVELPPAGER